MANGPLDGIVVLDLSRILAGPWSAQLLADFGAEVIKVERPDFGDDTRHWGPPWVSGADGRETSDAAYFHATNRNKKSLTVDIADPAGQRVIRELAARSDILIENFKKGDLERYGLDSQSLRTLNPRLIYCTISAYGRDSSKAALPGYDAMIQASGGLMSVTGDADEEGGHPQKTGVAIADIMAGMYATAAILAAVYERSCSGTGQDIEVPLYDSQVAWLANQNMNYLHSGKAPGRIGTAHPNISPYQLFEASDGYVMIAVGNDLQFSKLVAGMSRPELAADSRFCTNSSRVDNRSELAKILASEFARYSVTHWLDLSRSSGIPAGPVNSIATVLEDDYALERPLVYDLPHKLAGKAPTVANPVRFSKNCIDYRTAAPVLGEHTREILAATLGYTDEEIEAMMAKGVV